FPLLTPIFHTSEEVENLNSSDLSVLEHIIQPQHSLPLPESLEVVETSLSVSLQTISALSLPNPLRFYNTDRVYVSLRFPYKVPLALETLRWSVLWETEKGEMSQQKRNAKAWETAAALHIEKPPNKSVAMRADTNLFDDDAMSHFLQF
ncbi:hypothetical protein AVEN_228288-1, partial [Araneus ventricosus]